MKLHFPSRRATAFTLVELIVVMAIMIVLIGLSAPAINAMKRSSDVTTAGYDIVDAFEQARAYAIANNTYVYLGLQEVDGIQSSTVTPQKDGAGRVAIAVVAIKDGTRGISNLNDVKTSWTTDYKVHKGSIFNVVKKLQVFDNLHIAATLSAPPATGPMARYSVVVAQLVGNSSFKSSYTTFSWPLGTDFGSGQYNFSKVFTFSPQGIPAVYYDSQMVDISIVNWFELGLQQTNGNAVPTPPPNASVGGQVAIMISGVTGITRLFRP